MIILPERMSCSTNGEFSVVNITYENYLGQFGGGGFMLTGKVGVCLDGVLGSVCDVNWDVNDASVFCNGIGLGENYGEFYTNMYIIETSHQRDLVRICCLGVVFFKARYSVSFCECVFISLYFTIVVGPA